MILNPSNFPLLTAPVSCEAAYSNVACV